MAAVAASAGVVHNLDNEDGMVLSESEDSTVASVTTCDIVNKETQKQCIGSDKCRDCSFDGDDLRKFIAN
jgi:hypothetical protein